MARASCIALLGLSLLVGCSKASGAQAPQDGPTLFASTCARCHGAAGGGGVAFVDGGPAPRNFRDHAFQSARTDAELKAVIANGKGNVMPAFGGAFSDAQITQLVKEVRSFDPERHGP